MNRIVASTNVYVPREEVFAFLVDFTRYAKYSKYLTEVRRAGDGGPGTAYEIEFAWWRLSYVLRSRVTAVDPPEAIHWRVTKDFSAHGSWTITPSAGPEGADGSRVALHVVYDPSSVSRDTIDLPRFLSLDRVIDKAKRIVEDEAERVVEGVVADLEGEPRPVDVSIDYP